MSRLDRVSCSDRIVHILHMHLKYVGSLEVQPRTFLTPRKMSIANVSPGLRLFHELFGAGWTYDRVRIRMLVECKLAFEESAYTLRTFMFMCSISMSLKHP